MDKRRTSKQKQLIEHLKSKYLVRKDASPYDLANTVKPEIFRNNKKKDRNYNNVVDHAKKDLTFVNFAMNHLQPHFRMKILASNEFQNLITNLLDIDEMKFKKLSNEEKERSLDLAQQMLVYCLNVIAKTMPNEFKPLLVERIKPLNVLLKSIYNYSKNNNLKDIPRFNEIILPMVDES